MDQSVLEKVLYECDAVGIFSTSDAFLPCWNGIASIWRRLLHCSQGLLHASWIGCLNRFKSSHYLMPCLIIPNEVHAQADTVQCGIAARCIVLPCRMASNVGIISTESIAAPFMPSSASRPLQKSHRRTLIQTNLRPILTMRYANRHERKLTWQRPSPI